MTYPVTFKINTHIPGGSDAFSWMRSLWYTSIALASPGKEMLWHDDLLFYPTGLETMAFPSAFNQGLYLLLSHYLNVNIIYSILWLLSFVIGAYGTYLLAYYLTKNKSASFISGIIFSFSPYHFVHAMGHLGATTVLWIPFCALYLMKVFKEPSTKNSIYAGVFFVLVAMSDMQYLIFMGLFVFLLFSYELYSLYVDDRQSLIEIAPNLLRKYLLFGLVALVGTIPLTFNEILIASSENNFLKPGTSEAATYSADLLSFFLPSNLHPLFKNMVMPIHSNFTGNPSETTMFLGYTVLFLSLLTFIWLRHDKTVRFWIISAFAFSILCLGPVLHIMGHAKFTPYHIPIPLPYEILRNIIPFLENSRTPGRLFVIAALSFSVIAGYGINALSNLKRLKGNLIPMIMAVLIVFEYLSIPFPVSSADQPSFYKTISNDNGHYALLEIPATKNYGAGVHIIYYQTMHGKPMVGGQAARTQPNASDFERLTPLIKELTYLEQSNDIIKQDLIKIGASVLNYYDIKYVILHKKYLSEMDFRFASQLLRSTLNIDPIIYKNDSLIVYEVPEVPMQTFLIMGSGFYDSENWSGTPTRWMQANASLLINSPDNRTATLGLNAQSFYRNRTLEITSGGVPAAQIAVPMSLINVSVPIPLIKGANILSLHVPEGCERPCDKQELNNPDSRCLSMAMRNIAIS
ncbi:MAG: hypothetical protein WAW52_15405 [Methanothrix sp.]